MFRRPFLVKRGKRWTLSFRNSKTNEVYFLQSDSIGKLLGYIAIPIEEGMRPPIEWRVTFSNVNGRSFTLEPLWPAENDPVEQILSASVEIDPKLVRAQSEPDFFKHENGKRHRLSLEATLGGRPTRAISLKKTDRNDAQRQKRVLRPSTTWSAVSSPSATTRTQTNWSRLRKERQCQIVRLGWTANSGSIDPEHIGPSPLRAKVQEPADEHKSYRPRRRCCRVPRRRRQPRLPRGARAAHRLSDRRHRPRRGGHARRLSRPCGGGVERLRVRDAAHHQ